MLSHSRVISVESEFSLIPISEIISLVLLRLPLISVMETIKLLQLMDSTFLRHRIEKKKAEAEDKNV